MTTATTNTSRTRRRVPSVGTLLIGAVVVLAVLLAGARSLGTARTGTLDPENSRADGGRAVAQVLEELGVEVAVARGREDLDGTPVDDATTVVVTSTGQLGPSTLDHLESVVSGAGAHTVYVEPGDRVADHVAGIAPERADVTGSVQADCAGPHAGLTLAVTRAETYGPDGCFPVSGGAVLTEPVPGTTFFGAGQALQNGRVTDGDNAAVALRLLGDAERLVWYVPSTTDLTTEEATGAEPLVPAWTGQWLWLLLFAGVTLALWRGRRLGPLAVEPLPVVVHAIETTAGSGRMLRRGGDRAHAALVLRNAARRRISTHLQVDALDLRTLVAATAARTGRPTEEVDDLLGRDAPVPPTDAALVRLGQELTTLTEEVRHP